MADPLRLAYLAGFFDGEGCVHIGRSARGDKSYHRLTVSVSQNDPAPLLMLADAFDGKVLPAKSGYIWQRVGRPAQAVLETLLPYLVVKAEQARLGVTFMQTYRGRARGCTPITAFETAERDSFAEAFRAVRGPLAQEAIHA